MKIVFLSLPDVLQIHKDQIERYGGDSGIRDLELLKSAIAMPESGMGDKYYHPGLFDMAAAYLYHLIQNHPFIDGNKRTGVVTALVFLIINGVELNFEEEELENLIWEVAKGRLDKRTISEFFSKHSES